MGTLIRWTIKNWSTSVITFIINVSLRLLMRKIWFSRLQGRCQICQNLIKSLQPIKNEGRLPGFVQGGEASFIEKNSSLVHSGFTLFYIAYFKQKLKMTQTSMIWSLNFLMTDCSLCKRLQQGVGCRTEQCSGVTESLLSWGVL